MNALRKKYSDYSYKEATLNPINPRNKALEWESDIVNTFRNNPEREEISGTRDTPGGRSLYLARTLQIKDKGCLTCHTTPAEAPPAMIKIYGPNSGFGWKHMEVVGAQIVSVPMSLPIQNANRAFYTFMGSLSAVFVVLFIILNVMMSFLIVRPITKMSEAANEISTGNKEIPEFSEQGGDEVTLLAKSFNRMRRSLEKAIEMIEKK
jgi:protein-histidine pros-kinase